MNLVQTRHARETAARTAQREVANRPVYVDTETTGLGRNAQIVDICVLDADGSVLVDTLVRPAGRIPLNVTRVHGITDAMVREAPTWPELWPAVLKAIAGRPVAIYNVEFDTRMIYQDLRRHQLAWTPADTRFFCVMRLYAEFRAAWDARRRGFRWHSLGEAGRHCGLVLPNAHRARADALLTRELLHYMADQAPPLLF